MIFHQKFVRGDLTHFIDSSPKTQHTCCRGQWHEYHKHGCAAGISFDDWWQAIKNCLVSFNPNYDFIRSCRFDHVSGCNYPEEVTDVNITTTIGCKEGYPTCIYLCSEYVNSKFCDFYRNEEKGVEREVRFLVPNVYTPDLRRDSPNCYCQMDLRNRRWYKTLPYEIVTPVREYKGDVDKEKKKKFMRLKLCLLLQNPMRYLKLLLPLCLRKENF